MKPDTGRKSRFLPTPPTFNAPIRGRGSRQNIAMTFGTEKSEWCGYPMVKRFEDVFIRFDRIYERDRRTDRRTPHDRIGRDNIAIKSVSLALEISLKIATRINISSFKVAVVVFTRALSEQRG